MVLWWLLTAAVAQAQPWVQPEAVAGALAGRHYAVWASHGRYYNAERGAWMWQRPPLWETREDLLTETFTVPFLMPMLEGAGAVVYSPRERDWQREMAVVDADGGTGGVYKEGGAWTDAGTGYAHRTVLHEGENPFRMGGARQCQTAGKPNAAAVWVPRINVAGEYAVYVSYKSVAGSVADARYTVVHGGVATRLRVNQRMGGGTWVYLGTYEFGEGETEQNCVILTNESMEAGVVTADAVRLGGGMGNTERGGATSGLARHLEGARYNLQFAGLPDTVYHHFESDYTDDYTSRAHAVNYLDTALNVPFDAVIAVHSDAGYTAKKDSIIGTMTIVTTAGRDSVDRHQLASLTLQTIDHDLTQLYGRWTARELRDANYAETRIPRAPAMIVETLSHQNEADMRLAHRPRFKFDLARAIYKAIVRYQAGEDATIEPLPPVGLTATVRGGGVRLTWEEQRDPLEPSARARGYLVYMAREDGGWDNGTYTEGRELRLAGLTAGRTYRFRVRAVNEGGMSLPSEERWARVAEGPSVLIASDEAMLPRTTEYCGRVTGRDTTRLGDETEGGYGYSTSELEGRMVVGPPSPPRGDVAMGRPISTSPLGGLGGPSLADYDLIVVNLGTEGAPLTRAAERALTRHTRRGGALIVSGARVTERTSEEFQREVLHTRHEATLTADSLLLVTYGGFALELQTQKNERTPQVERAEALQGGEETLMRYDFNFRPAAVRTGRVVTLGFPIEATDHPSELMEGLITRILEP